MTLRRVKLGNKVTFERMATACGIQKTYLSRVLNSADAHLSADQLYQACLYLGLTRQERRYAGLLLEYERSTCTQRREELGAELEELRRKSQRSESYMAPKVAGVNTVDLATYFLDPDAILVHVFLTSSKYRTDLALIQRRLSLSDTRFSAIMAQLRAKQLIEIDERGNVRVLQDELHLPVDTDIYPAYRTLQRLRTIDRLRTLDEQQAYSFSAVFTADEAICDRIKGVLLEALREIEKLATNAPATEVYQVNLDLFDWSR